jgi:hypothetical protein
VHQITIGFEEISQVGKGRSVLYFIWHEPTFVVGKNTFIDSVLTKIGFVNYCNLNRYPELIELRNPFFIAPSIVVCIPDAPLLSGEEILVDISTVTSCVCASDRPFNLDLLEVSSK